MKIAAAFVGGLLLGVFLGTLATKEERYVTVSPIHEVTLHGPKSDIMPPEFYPPIGWTH